MSKIRVHELARELGRQNKEVIECLKSGGIDVKSHMSNVDEAQAAMVKQKFRNMGKEQMILPQYVRHVIQTTVPLL